MGTSADRFDNKGREKVQCHICLKWYHRLDVHLTTHEMKVADYQVKYPGAPTISESARKKAATAQGSRSKGAAKAKKAAANKGSTVDDGLYKFGVARLKERTDLTEHDRKFIPVHDENWIPGDTEQKQLEELAMAMEDDDNCLIVGPHGIGKSTLVLELAAICGQPVQRVGMDGDVRRADFVGEKNVVVDKDSGQTITEWRDGVLVNAAIHGHWLMIDEIDAMPPHIAFVMHGVLEGNRHLVLMGDDARKVKFHPDFRIIATANTLGRGDDSGMYAGTNVMNEAFLDRWGVTIKADYPDESTEANILTARTGVDGATARKMVSIAKKVREACANEQCFVTISTRRLIDWAQKTVRLNDARRAAALTVINKMGEDDAKFVDSVIQRYFGGEVS